MKNTRQFIVADPATFEGHPYEVASRAVAQASAVAAILTETLENSRKMVLNAEMERQLHFEGEADIEKAEAGPLNKRIDAVLNEIRAAHRSLAVLERAASFDPKNPPQDAD